MQLSFQREKPSSPALDRLLKYVFNNILLEHPERSDLPRFIWFVCWLNVFLLKKMKEQMSSPAASMDKMNKQASGHNHL